MADHLVLLRGLVTVIVRRTKLAAAFERAMRAPYNRGLWDDLDRADASMWEHSTIGPNHGQGREWDNRRKGAARC